MNPRFWKRTQGMSDAEKKRIAREYLLKSLVNQILRAKAAGSETNNISLISALNAVNKEDVCFTR